MALSRKQLRQFLDDDQYECFSQEFSFRGLDASLAGIVRDALTHYFSIPIMGRPRDMGDAEVHGTAVPRSRKRMRAMEDEVQGSDQDNDQGKATS